MKKLSVLSAFASSSAALGAALLVSTSLLGTTGCGAFGMTYSLTGLTVEPGAGLTCIPPGAVAQFKAYGSYTEGGHTTKIEDITSQVTWSVTLPELARVNASGLLTAGTSFLGTTAIVASAQGEFGTLAAPSDVKISTNCSASALARPRGLTIVPAEGSLSVGDNFAPLAVASEAAGQRAGNQPARAAWSSSNPGVATVDAHGIIRAVEPGDATVTAVSGAGSATTTIHVSGQAQDQ